MKDLTPIRGRRYILDLILQGEHETQDFKYAISDARKIARSISAFANHSGGRLLVGVKDNGIIAGVRNDEDIYVIEQAARIYCTPSVDIDFTAFSTGDTGIVIRATVPQAISRPVKAQDTDGRWRAYYRVADENISAHPLMVRAWMRQSSTDDCLYDLAGPAAQAIIRHVTAHGRVSVDDALRLGHASRATLQEAIIALAAMQVLQFAYTGTAGFVIEPGPDLAT